MGIDIFFKRNTRVKSAIKLEKSVAGTCIFYIVVRKFYYRQELCPVIFIPIDRYLEIGLNSGVLPLGLAIYVRIKWDTELTFDAKEVI